MNIWGPFRGGNERTFDDYYLGLDPADEARVLQGFEKWKHENRGKPDKLTISITSKNTMVGTYPNNLTKSIVGVSFQSNTGDSSDRAVMHVHPKDGDLLIIQNVAESGARLVQITSP